MKIEVAYATPDKQLIIQTEIAEQSTVEAAIIQSGILNQFPEIDLNKQAVGIFSKKVSLDHIPEEGERIEIYRPLVIDPKTARRVRAERQNKE